MFVFKHTLLYILYQTDFQLSTWLAEQGLPSSLTQLTELAASKLLEHLDISEYLQQPSCDLNTDVIYSNPDSHGWNTGILKINMIG